MKKKNAFTLAEVLITLGIIGIVAAMTLPMVITKYQKKTTVEKLKKTYVQLNLMLNSVKAEYGDLEVFAQKPAQFVPNVVAKYYNGAKVYPPSSDHKLAMCYDKNTYLAGVHSTSGAIAQYAGLSKNGGSKPSGYIQTPFLPNHTVSLKLADGTCIGFNQLINQNGYKETSIFVDINGSNNRPNILGRDLFFFTYDPKSETIKPSGWDLENPKCLSVPDGYTLRGSVCASQIINDGWEIKDDYPW